MSLMEPLWFERHWYIHLSPFFSPLMLLSKILWFKHLIHSYEFTFSLSPARSAQKPDKVSGKAVVSQEEVLGWDEQSKEPTALVTAGFHLVQVDDYHFTCLVVLGPHASHCSLPDLFHLEPPLGLPWKYFIFLCFFGKTKFCGARARLCALSNSVQSDVGAGPGK